jgi:biopolymer transport protein ExbB
MSGHIYGNSGTLLAVVLMVLAQSFTGTANPQTNQDHGSASPAASAAKPTPGPLDAGEQFDSRLSSIANAAVLALSRYIDKGAPFLLQERATRIHRLGQLPSGSEGELAEKYRRLLEAYRIELDYGKTIEVYRDLLRVDRDERLVEFLRVGSLALYYQTLDGSEAGIWDKRQRQWFRLTSEQNEAITQGLRIAKKLDPPQLMVLPLFGTDGKFVPTQSTAFNSSLPAVDTAFKIQNLSPDMEVLTEIVRDFVAGLKNSATWPLPGVTTQDDITRLAKLAEEWRMATVDDFISFFALIDKLLNAQASIARFTASVYAPDGHATEREVLRVGSFTLIADGRYLIYTPEVGRLIELPRQPSSGLLAMAQDFTRHDPETLANVAIDPSSGQTLQLLVQIPDLRERIAQGGAVGYLILLLAGSAFALSGYRFVQLALVGKRVRRQLQAPAPRLDNPLGRILAKLEQSPLTDEEALYLLTEDALSNEQASLDYALTFLKLIAAIAPMLGLLGTVTGMIETFQAIALHGSGDPKLMSGGISEALVTTVEGLVTAIPILLLHSLLNSQSQSLGALLEAHVSVALAQRLDARTVQLSAQ